MNNSRVSLLVPCLQRISAKHGFILIQREVFVVPTCHFCVSWMQSRHSKCGRNHGSFTKSDICSIDSEPEILLMDNILHPLMSMNYSFEASRLVKGILSIKHISSMISVPQTMTFYCNSRPSTFVDTKTSQRQHFSPVPFEGTGNSGR